MFCKEEFKKDLLEIKKMNDHIDYMIKVGSDLDGPMVEPLCKQIEFAIDLMGRLYQDEYKWISYFIWDCQFGEKPLDVFVNKKTFDYPFKVKYNFDSIDTFVDFYEKEEVPRETQKDQV